MALGLPRPARLYLFAVLAAGSIALGASAASLRVAEPTVPWHVVVSGALLVLVANFFLQTRSPVLAWRGERIALHPDEAVLLVAVVALPGGAVVVAAALATFLAQAHQQKPPLKMAFNAATHSAAAGAAALLYGLLVGAGVPVLAAAASVPLVVSTLNQTLVAGLLTLLAERPLRTLWKPALRTSIAMSAVAGVTLGLLAMGLYDMHPLAVVLLAPVGYLLVAAMASELRHENELSVRRELNRLAEVLAGDASEDALVDAVETACREAFPVRSFVVELSLPGEEPREFRRYNVLRAGETREISVDLVDGRGGRLGRLAVAVAWRGDAQEREDRGLLSLVGGYLSMSLTTLGSMRAARAAERKVRSAFDSIDDPILVWSRDGRLVQSNAAARALLGGDERATWLDLDRVLEPEAMDRILGWLALHPGETGTLVVHDRGEGDARRTFEVTLSPLTIAHGEVGTLLVLRDATQRLRLEREAERNREVAARKDRLASLGVLVAGVAHEINNPLFYMQGNVELAVLDLEDAEAAIRAGQPPPDLHETRARLATVLAGIDRVGRIARALKAVARKERPRPDAPIDVNDVLRECGALLRSQLPAGVTLDVVAAQEPLHVDADPADVHEALIHLAKNAIEALGPDGGHVEVRGRTRAGTVEIAVSDTGCGIPRDDHARLFVPFHTTKPDGIGLGLPMVHTLVTNLGGMVTFDSEAGKGTTFTVALPRVRQAPPLASRPQDAS